MACLTAFLLLTPPMRMWLLSRDGGAWVLVSSPVFKTGVRRDERLRGVRFPCTSAIAVTRPSARERYIIAVEYRRDIRRSPP